MIRARVALGMLAARPFHAALTALVAGLAAGPRAPWLITLLTVAAGVGAARGAWRPVAAATLVAALLGGAVVADARLAALDRTALGPRLGHVGSSTVTLLEPPRRRAGGARAAVVRLAGERALLRASRRVPWPRADVGAELAVFGALAPLGARDGWLRVRAVHATLAAEAIRVTGRRRGGLAGAVDRVRAAAERALAAGLPPELGALLRGMALGQDDGLDDGTREAFRAAGLSHLVAASGQNVMLLAALALGLAAITGLGVRARGVLVLALIALYVPLAGAGPSIQRAGVMGAAGVVAMLASRPASRWYALLLAAAVTLTLNPRALEEPGWQLSFAAVIAILVVGTPLGAGLRSRGWPAGAADATALALAATLGTAPLVAMHFERTSLVSLPANVLAAPAVAPVMWLGMLAAVAGQVTEGLATPFTALAGFPLAYLSWLARAAAAVPGAEASAPLPVVLAGCAGLCALALGVTRPAARAVALRVAVAAAIVMAAAGAFALCAAGGGGLAPPAGLRVSFLDIGQGDATLIQHRRTSVLFDAGPPDGPILARLRRAGVRRLDLLVATHGSDDHIGGVPAVLGAMPVGLVLDGRDGASGDAPRALGAALRARHVRAVAGQAGQVLRVGAIVVRVLWPPAEPAAAHAGEDANLRTIVADVQADGWRALLTADSESVVLSRLALRPVDLLKVSHHGSADPGLPAVLARLRPRLASIPVGRRNSYGHPAPATLAALAAAHVPTVRTDRDGTIRVEPRGGRDPVLTVRADHRALDVAVHR